MKYRAWRTAGAAVSVALHVLALLAFEAAFKRSAETRAADLAHPAPAITVELVRLPGKAHHALEASRPSDPLPAPAPSPGAAHAPPQDQAAVSEPAGNGVDDEGLYRVPFRGAAGQAYASLRGGLGCAHVDLAKLPAPMRARCAGASKRSTAVAIARPGPAEAHRPEIDKKWVVAPTDRPRAEARPVAAY